MDRMEIQDPRGFRDLQARRDQQGQGETQDHKEKEGNMERARLERQDLSETMENLDQLD